MSERDVDTWVWCGHCGAAAWGVPPHGENTPCPMTVMRAEHEMSLRAEVAAADNAKTEAERRYWEKATERLGTVPGLRELLRR